MSKRNRLLTTARRLHRRRRTRRRDAGGNGRPGTAGPGLIKDLVDTGCLMTGKQAGTYYAADKGLTLLEQAD